MLLRSLEEAKLFVVVDGIACAYYAQIGATEIENAKQVDSITPEQRWFLKGLTFGPINR